MSRDLYFDLLHTAVSQYDVDLLVVITSDLHKLDKLTSREISRTILEELPSFSRHYGIPLVSSLKEFVELYDEKEYSKKCQGLPNDCIAFFAGRDDLRNVKIAIKKGAILEEGLEIAAYSGHSDMVEFLLENGASNLRESLVLAVRRGHKDIVKLFLESGRVSGSDVEVAALAAILNRDQEILVYIVDTNLVTLNNLVQDIAKCNNVEAAKLFIERGVDKVDFLDEGKRFRKPRIITLASQ